MTREGERGIALIGVLWVGLLLTVIAGSLIQTVRVQTQTARNALDHAAAEAAAESGVALGVEELARRTADRTWRADGAPRSYRVPGGNVVVRLRDEGGRIDLNRAADSLLQALFEANGTPPDRAAALVDAVADWRDRDQERRLNGAEDADYRAAGLTYGAKDRPFERVGELRRVLGMTEALYRRVAPALTVYSGRRGVDLAVAPPVVLRVLPGLGKAAVGDALTGTAGTERAAALAALLTDRSVITTSSRRAFAIRAEARTDTGAVAVREAVVRLERRRDPPFVVFDWVRGRNAGPAAADGPSSAAAPRS